MGRKKPPPTPTYIDPKPVEEFNLSEEEKGYQQALRERLINQDALNPYLNEREKAFNESAIAQLGKIFDPMARRTREDVARRFGGLNTSVYSDITADLEEKKADAAAEMTRQYQQQTLADRMNWANNMMNQLATLRGWQAQPHEMGFAYANPKNMFNLGNYQNQLAHFQLSNPPSIWSRIFGGALGGLI